MTARRGRAAAPAPAIELEITALAAGGDGVGRDAGGRVTFVPRTAPGDRVRARIVHATASFARAELVEVLAPSAERVSPPCPHFAEGCGGCAWQHVARPAQLAAKQAIASGALRKLDGLVLHEIADPAPPLGWRRRARFHVAGGRVGLFALGSRRVLPIAACPQLEPALDAARAQTASASPPDGELALLAAGPACAVGVEAPWTGAARLVGRAGLRGVIAGGAAHGAPILELEPGLRVGPWDFAQASAAGNAALVACVAAAVGPPPAAGARKLLELYAGGGNLTRALVAAGWDVLASDAAPPAEPGASPGASIEGLDPADPAASAAPAAPAASAASDASIDPRLDPIQIATGSSRATWSFEQGAAADVLARAAGPFAVIVLDPPRAGAPEAIEGILRHAPATVVYVSCDAATLARDAARLVDGGYRATDAWPIDLMPQTAHVEVVLRFRRATPP